MTRRCPPTLFVIKLQAPPDALGIHALRALLKTLLRHFGLRCVSVRKEQPDLFRDYRSGV
jgi:hypothetical protein